MKQQLICPPFKYQKCLKKLRRAEANRTLETHASRESLICIQYTGAHVVRYEITLLLISPLRYVRVF